MTLLANLLLTALFLLAIAGLLAPIAEAAMRDAAGPGRALPKRRRAAPRSRLSDPAPTEAFRRRIGELP